MTPDGTLTTLHAFAGGQSGDGEAPQSAPIQGADGKLYGTTPKGGILGTGTSGTAYQMTLAVSNVIVRRLRTAACPRR